MAEQHLPNRGVKGRVGKMKPPEEESLGEVIQPPLEVHRSVSGPIQHLPLDLPPIDESAAIPAEYLASRPKKPAKNPDSTSS